MKIIKICIIWVLSLVVACFLLAQIFLTSQTSTSIDIFTNETPTNPPESLYYYYSLQQDLFLMGMVEYCRVVKINGLWYPYTMVSDKDSTTIRKELPNLDFICVGKSTIRDLKIIKGSRFLDKNKK